MALCDPLLFDKRHCKHCQESHFSAQITACGDSYGFPYELSWVVPNSEHNNYKSDHNFQSLSRLRADETCDHGLNVCAGLWSQPWFCVKAWRKEGHWKSHLALTPIGHYSDWFFNLQITFPTRPMWDLFSGEAIRQHLEHTLFWLGCRVLTWKHESWYLLFQITCCINRFTWKYCCS